MQFLRMWDSDAIVVAVSVRQWNIADPIRVY